MIDNGIERKAHILGLYVCFVVGKMELNVYSSEEKKDRKFKQRCSHWIVRFSPPSTQVHHLVKASTCESVFSIAVFCSYFEYIMKLLRRKISSPVRRAPQGPNLATWGALRGDHLLRRDAHADPVDQTGDAYCVHNAIVFGRTFWKEDKTFVQYYGWTRRVCL